MNQEETMAMVLASQIKVAEDISSIKDELVSEITDIKVIMAKNTASLEEHIKRTNILEEKIRPIEKHVIMIQGVIKFLLFLSGLAAIVKLIKF